MVGNTNQEKSKNQELVDIIGQALHNYKGEDPKVYAVVLGILVGIRIADPTVFVSEVEEYYRHIFEGKELESITMFTTMLSEIHHEDLKEEYKAE